MCIPLNPLKSSGAEVGLHFIDEPTNDLDIATLQILEDYLDSFAGIVMIVSHDRYFLDRTVRRIFAFEGDGKVTQYEGGYTDYEQKKQCKEQGITGVMQSAIAKSQESIEAASSKNWKAGKRKKLKFSYQEQKDYESIEGEIAAIEEALEMLEKEYVSCGSNFVRLNEIAAKKEALEKELEEKMERWMYLEDLAARIEKGEMVE